MATKQEIEKAYREQVKSLKETCATSEDGADEYRKELRKINSTKTLNDTRRNLKRYGLAAVVRPTGFGKSYMLSHLSQDYEKSLYVYPRTVIKDSVQKDYADVLNNVDFMSYRELLEMEKRDKLEEFIKSSGYQLIMLDEVHMAGATGAMQAIMTIKRFVGKTKMHMVGVTATPDRSDGIDVIGDILDNKVISEFTLHDCIKQGLMLKPHYVICMYDKELAKNQLAQNIESRVVAGGQKRGISENELKKVEIAVANIANAPTTIRDNIASVYGEDVEYMKFIVFFPNKEILKEQAEEVRNWFHSAFPDMKINALIITSDDSSKLDKLDNLSRRYNTIDLVMCIDMLNMGYHVSDITGVVMLRGTRSDIIYFQQMGRCLSVTSKHPAIIFDFVNNLSTKPYYAKDGTGMKGRPDVKDTLGNRMSMFEKRDLFIDDRVAKLEEIAGRIARGGITKEVYNEIVWWYTNRSAPLYVIQDKFNVNRAEVIKVLSNQGIEVEDETRLRTIISTLTTKESRRLYNANDKRRQK